MEIVIDKLTKKYGKKTVLDNVSLNITKGMYGLLGKNGAGKTTLMRILATLLEKDAGEITICDISIEKTKEIRNIIGYLPQEFSFYPNQTVYDALDYLGILSGISTKERKVKIKKILEQVNLTKERNTTFKHLSGGMKRRLGIAQALLNDPKVLIVDEPTVGLDPEERIRFHNLLTELANSRIVLLSTHIVSDIETTCNNLASLHEGKVLFSGNAKKLKEKAQNKVFIIEVEKEKINKIKEKYKVINMIQEDNKIKCRIVSLITPKEKHTVVTPTIEDGYMYILESEKK